MDDEIFHKRLEHEKNKNRLLEKMIEERTRELYLALQEAEKATQAKNDFLSSVSHEIRTPLNGVLGMTSLLLQKDNFSDREVFYLETIEKSGDILLSLINDILDYSKLEALKMELEIAPVDLRGLIEDIAFSFSGTAAKKGLEIFVQYQVKAPTHVLGDEGRLRQILTNLIGNGIKFTDSGHILIAVRYKCLENKHYFHFEVNDTGPGVPQEFQSKLFEKFSQGSSTLSQKNQGTGLGLAISRKLVKLMKGEIGYKESPEKGSTFWFEVPLDLEKNDKPSPALSLPIHSVKVIIVDDLEINRLILQELIMGWNIKCDSCSSGNEALHMMKEAKKSNKPYHIAIVDHLMPIMDGVSFGKSIQKDPDLHETVLVMLSSVKDHFNPQELEESGFVGVVLKPVNSAKLLELLQRASRHFLSKQERQLGESIRQRIEVSAEEFSLRKPIILVVDDNIPNQIVAKALLESLNCSVNVAANGQEAVEMWRQFSYQMILMDLQMPVLSGLEAARTIRKLEKEAGTYTPIIALSAHVSEMIQKECKEAGFDGFLEKPVKVTSLKSKLIETQIIPV